ncbi:MAG: DUF2310 family Zn-ribbon-containing protein [Phycisphaerae bacterium]|nr:DUF2310 family Zn-ribbon-containing protein [Phycisphaerales bacterium]
MYTAEIQFRVLRKTDGEAVTDAIDMLIVSLCRGGQISSGEWPLAASRTEVRTFVRIPERNSLQRKYESKWMARERAALKDAGLSQPKYKIIGIEPNALDVCRCKENTAFILYRGLLVPVSPLRCFDCFGPVPLYRIPPTSWCDTYEDILMWKSDYERCDGLHIGSGVGERFGTRQISVLDSELSKDGLECCRRITELTKKPCYYYLYRYGGRSRKSEEQRLCPSCGKRWRLKTALHDKFDFRCDRCLLLSNVAYAVT